MHLSKRTSSHKYSTGLDGYAMLLLSCLIILITGSISLIYLFIRVYNTARAANNSATSNATYLLTGMKLTNNQPNKLYLQRLTRAMDIAQTDPSSMIIILGGYTGISSVSESYAGKNFLINHGVCEKQIKIEENSQNTLENMKQAKLLLNRTPSSVTIISQRYHLERCRVFASSFGLTNKLCAADKIIKLSFKTTCLILKEAFHLHWYYTGFFWAHITHNRKMLSRIS